jgi:hypothetical protein
MEKILLSHLGKYDISMLMYKAKAVLRKFLKLKNEKLTFKLRIFFFRFQPENSRHTCLLSVSYIDPQKVFQNM